MKFTITTLLILLSVSAQAEDVIRETPSGHINWTEGKVYATGYGTAKPGLSAAQKRILSRRAAVVDAQRNLLEITKGVRINSTRTTDQAMQQSTEIATRVEGIIKGAIVSKEHFQNEVSTVTMVMPIGGEFMSIMVPDQAAVAATETPFHQQYTILRPDSDYSAAEDSLSGYLISDYALTAGRWLADRLVQPAHAADALVIRDDSEARAYRKLLEWMGQVPPPGIDQVLKDAISSYESNSQFSGLLIDASGVPGFELATVPKIRDEDGNVIYPSDRTSYEDIINNRGVTYDFDLNDAVRNHRVATTPFVIKALSTYQNLPSDLIITRGDAARIQQSASTVDAMNKTGVLIVVAI
ncbi:MAG: hypothetical protein KDI36_19140 [Pseudomonadales bacterium]|nr:hypothetical protein [Pseudomonadales bacterium]